MATKKKKAKKVPDAVREYMAEIGKRGGEAPAKKPKGLAALTKARRKQIQELGRAAAKRIRKFEAKRDAADK